MSDPSLVGAADPAADPSKITDPDSSVSRADPIGTGDEAQDALEETPTTGYSLPTPLDKLNRRDAQQTQFPSLHGQTGIEVAERSSDVTEPRTRKHRKIFRVFTSGLDFDAEGFDHGPNYTAARQYMTSHGLRPVGDVALVEVRPFDDRNVDLVYEVEAIPAAVATDPETVNVVVSQQG